MMRAIARWIFLEVSLVVFLGAEKGLGWDDFGDDGTLKDAGFVEKLFGLLSRLLLCVIVIKNRGTVLA